MNHLHLVQQGKEAEVADLRQELSALEQELQTAKAHQVESDKRQTQYGELEMELEKERGRLAGTALRC